MRYALIADVHANWTALKSVAADAEQQAVDGFWCLGDLLGYGPQPAECLRFLYDHQLAGRWVLGNHDAALLGLLDERDFNADARGALELNRQALAAEPQLLERFRGDAASGRDQPVSEPTAAANLVFTHACLAPGEHVGRSVTSYLYPWKSALLRWNCFDPLRQSYLAGYKQACLLFGHTHIPTFAVAEVNADDSLDAGLRPFAYGVPQALEGPLVAINPGSVGQPRDGDARAAYAVLDTAEHTITFRRVPYNVALTQARMQRDSYPERLRDRLRTADVPEDASYLASVYRPLEQGYALSGSGS